MPNIEHHFSNLGDKFYSPTHATAIANPHWVIRNANLAKELKLDLFDEHAETFLSAFSGAQPLSTSKPLAMVYSGHQFGQYVSQLGDGRGLLLGEIETENDRFDLHLKGAGPTPYSRMGDGRAVLRSSIREYLAGEALHALGIASTRSLCLTSGELSVWREQQEPAAMLVRVAKSHVRFGSFEYFHYTKQYEQVKQLADFCIDHYYPDSANQTSAERYAHFFEQVIKKTALMIAQWQAYGFAHGVMNTDNMSIVGETFDFGPYGFLDDYDPSFICNHSDHSGRYAFEAQPSIGLWNLHALGQSLSSLLNEEQIKVALNHYQPHLIASYSAHMRAKLGWLQAHDEDQTLVSELLQLMHGTKADFCRTFRQLSSVATDDRQHPLRDSFVDRDGFDQWLARYQQRLKKEPRSDAERQSAMNAVNPKYILRNYLAQQAISQAEQGDYTELERLATVLSQPFAEQTQYEDYAKPPPDWGKRISVSCSS